MIKFDVLNKKKKKHKESVEKPVLSDEEKKKRRLKKRTQELIIKTVVLIAGIIILVTLVFGVHVVHDNNMYPSLRDGDLVITYRLVNVYMSDHVFAYKHDGRVYFGRIVGVAGDVIDMTSDGYYKVNGNVPYEDHFYDTLSSSSKEITYPYKVPEKSVFILGDYRLQTEDSRSFGAIPIRDLEGEVALTLRRRGF